MKFLRLTYHAKHDLGDQLRALSDLVDEHPGILTLIEQDLIVPDTASTGANGLSVESVFRCSLLKQITGVSYEKLAFHLCDSPTYRTFARLNFEQMPRRSGLQSTICQITPQTLQQVNEMLMTNRVDQGLIGVDALRIDSTVVKSNIHDPHDSQSLDDGVRMLSRMMAKCKEELGVKLRCRD